MTTELDVRIVVDDQATIIGIASFDDLGTVTLLDPAFIVPDQGNKAQFIPVLLAMGIHPDEDRITITADKLKFGKAFKPLDEVKNAYLKDFGYTVLDLPEEKKLILE